MVEVRTNGGHTPLALALLRDHQKCAKVLMDAGALLRNVHKTAIQPWAARYEATTSVRIHWLCVLTHGIPAHQTDHNDEQSNDDDDGDNFEDLPFERIEVQRN